MDLADRIQRGLSYLLSFVILAASVGAFFEGQWLNAFLAALAFVLSYVPSAIEKNLKIGLPIEFEFTFVVFLFVTIYLGDINAYYTYFWWWDIFLHTLSGVLLGLVGFILVYIFHSEEKIRLRLSPFFVGLFTFVFAVSIGVFWEIFEFGLDQLFGLDTQHGSLEDTMLDLIVDALGALFISVIAYFYMKKVRFPVFDRIITRFLEKNPRMFRRWRKPKQT
ncbi:MAG: hypothetical protein AB7J40_01040 [Candidatus Altimarinota bacterium]